MYKVGMHQGPTLNLNATLSTIIVHPEPVNACLRYIVPTSCWFLSSHTLKWVYIRVQNIRNSKFQWSYGSTTQKNNKLDPRSLHQGMGPMYEKLKWQCGIMTVLILSTTEENTPSLRTHSSSLGPIDLSLKARSIKTFVVIMCLGWPKMEQLSMLKCCFTQRRNKTRCTTRKNCIHTIEIYIWHLRMWWIPCR